MLLKGALIEFKMAIGVPVPNVIIFQFNPETMVHTWAPGDPTPKAGLSANPRATKGSPEESFSFTLIMDAADTVAENHPVTAQLAAVSGLYTRLAALEMLLYPDEPAAKLLAPAAGKNGQKRNVPVSNLPTVLFVWGPGRILPVRVTNLTITERLYAPTLLNPIHAEVQIGLRVIMPEELKPPRGKGDEIALTAYEYSQRLREALAVLNLANAADSIVGMLPVSM